MSRRIIEWITCSLCGSQGHGEPPAWNEVRVSINGKGYEYDLCEECCHNVDLGDMRSLLAKGIETQAERSPKKPGRTKLVSTPSAYEVEKARQEISEDSRSFCKVAGCDYAAHNAQTLAAHVRKHHRPAPVPQDRPCEVKGCSFVAKSPQGLGAHRKAVHGIAGSKYKTPKYITGEPDKRLSANRGSANRKSA